MRVHCSILIMAATTLACTPGAPAPVTVASAERSPGRVEVADEEAGAVVAFWVDAGPSMWFAKDPQFDQRFRERFQVAYQAAAAGHLDHWLQDAQRALALCLLLDQYPRNAFRGTPRMYATDALARNMANEAIVRGHDRTVDPSLALFFYLPFAHSEELRDQERSVELNQRLGPDALRHAQGHRDIIRRFGRFPHRNPILKRAMRSDEQKFLDEGGFSG